MNWWKIPYLEINVSVSDFILSEYLTDWKFGSLYIQDVIETEGPVVEKLMGMRTGKKQVSHRLHAHVDILAQVEAYIIWLGFHSWPGQINTHSSVCIHLVSTGQSSCISLFVYIICGFAIDGCFKKSIFLCQLMHVPNTSD